MLVGKTMIVENGECHPRSSDDFRHTMYSKRPKSEHVRISDTFLRPKAKHKSFERSDFGCFG